MKINEALEKDIPEVLELAKEFILEHRKISCKENSFNIDKEIEDKKKIFEKNLQSGKGKIFAAEVDGSFAGYIFVLKSPPLDDKNSDQGYISDLYVHPEFRKKDFAKELIKQSEKWLKKEGQNGICLDVNANNNKAKYLYKKLDYNEKSIHMFKKFREKR